MLTFRENGEDNCRAGSKAIRVKTLKLAPELHIDVTVVVACSEIGLAMTVVTM